MLRRWYPCDLAWRHWGDEFVFHVAATGSVHLVEGQAGQFVLELMELPGGATAADLLARFEMDNPPTEADVQAVDQMLDHLQRIGLARSQPPH